MNDKLKLFEDRIRNKKVAILGIGVSNRPLVKYFYDLGCDITIFNEKETDYDNLYNVKLELGKDCLNKLEGFDYIFRSPSILPTRKELVKAKENGAIITSEIEEVIKLTPSKVIGVTGSDGKTTTTTLINEVLKANSYNTFLGGNIGIPLFTKIKDMTKDDIVVLELSSFQLMDMKVSPNISIITNISENHLDIHKNFMEYIDSKKNIFKYQDLNDLLVINADNDIIKDFKGNGKTKHFSRSHEIEDGFFLEDNYIKRIKNGKKEKVLMTDDITIRGIHNYENICTVLTALEDLIDLDKAKEVIKKFKGVEHRLEFVREINNVKWYNDSVSSSPTRTIAGINSYCENIVLIAGGYDKNISYEPLAMPIIEKVRVLILMGDTKDKIYNEVVAKLKDTDSLDINMASSLEEAVAIAYNKATNGDIVLFSPASASFDMFKNFADRGMKFKNIVNKLG